MVSKRSLHSTSFPIVGELSIRISGHDERARSGRVYVQSGTRLLLVTLLRDMHIVSRDRPEVCHSGREADNLVVMIESYHE